MRSVCTILEHRALYRRVILPAQRNREACLCFNNDDRGRWAVGRKSERACPAIPTIFRCHVALWPRETRMCRVPGSTSPLTSTHFSLCNVALHLGLQQLVGLTHLHVAEAVLAPLTKASSNAYVSCRSAEDMVTGRKGALRNSAPNHGRPITRCRYYDVCLSSHCGSQQQRNTRNHCKRTMPKAVRYSRLI